MTKELKIEKYFKKYVKLHDKISKEKENVSNKMIKELKIEKYRKKSQTKWENIHIKENCLKLDGKISKCFKQDKKRARDRKNIQKKENTLNQMVKYQKEKNGSNQVTKEHPTKKKIRKRW